MVQFVQKCKENVFQNLSWTSPRESSCLRQYFHKFIEINRNLSFIIIMCFHWTVFFIKQMFCREQTGRINIFDKLSEDFHKNIVREFVL